MNDSERQLKVAVYCSASEELPDEWVDAVRRLGEWIGGTGSVLVYGGVDAGLMRVVAQVVSHNGAGHIIGVVPEQRRDKASPLNDVTVPAEGLADRKAAMCDMADVFVVLPGGYGTLDELLSTLAYIRFHNQPHKKILLYNPDGLFDPLLKQFDVLIAAGLMARECLDAIATPSDIDSLLTTLDTFLSTNPASHD